MPIYYDAWDCFKNQKVNNVFQAVKVTNYRTQGEIEIKPFLNLVIRLKHKLQRKNKEYSPSTTNESTLRVINRISYKSYLNIEGKSGRNDNPAGGKTDGQYMGVDYSYKFSNKLTVESSFYFWETDGFSMWNFEDNSIDFMDGDGFKYYFVVTNYLSNNLQFKIFFKHKITKHDPDYEYDIAYYWDAYKNVEVRDFKYDDNFVVVKTYINLKF